MCLLGEYMNIRKSMLIAVLSILMAVAVTFGFIWLAQMFSTDHVEEEVEEEIKAKQTLYLWYTDEALTDYLTAVSVQYLEKSEVRVVPVLKTGKEYLLEINSASMSDEELPDLYLVTNDALEQAYLAGLACELPMNNAVNTEHFAQTAISAVTYDGHLVAYPFYFDTGALVYNKTYLMDQARSLLEAEADQAEAQEALEQEDTEATGETDETVVYSDEEVADRMQEMIPHTFEELESFADTYEAPEQVDDILRWDVTNIMYNYGFLGAYLNVGGECGDDESQLDIYNENSVRAMSFFQAMNQFYSIDADSITYEDVMQDFIDGKLVYTIAGTDAVASIEAAKAEGLFSSEYDVIALPDLTEDLASRPLSITTAVAVNGYSSQKSAAHGFASYLVTNAAADLYTHTGRAAAYTSMEQPYEGLDGFMDSYAKSVSMPKLMTTSNLWMRLEVAFAQVWGGQDANETLRSLAEAAHSQASGETVTLDPIVEEVQEPETEETATQESETSAAQ